MSEVSAAVTSLQLHLDQLHRSAGATMMDRHGWMVPLSYGDDLLEYASVRERGAGLLDLSYRGRFLVSGSEAVAFLNGLVTNDMKTLAENRWMPAIFPNVQGRLLASVRIIRLPDDRVPNFLIDTETTTHDRVLQTIQRFTLAGDFHVTDSTSNTVLLSLNGKAARTILKAVLGADLSAINWNGVSQCAWADHCVVTILRASHTGADGFDLILNSINAEQLWQSLVAAGARPVGNNALEILRIEAGIPVYGQDMDDTTVVTETNLDEAVSYTKGCYIGQEIIARIKYRGHVAKKLRGLAFDGPGLVEPGEPITSADDKEIGQVTSTTLSPSVGRRLALAYVKYDYIASGTKVKTSGGRDAEVVDLPFVNQQLES